MAPSRWQAPTNQIKLPSLNIPQTAAPGFTSGITASDNIYIYRERESKLARETHYPVSSIVVG